MEFINLCPHKVDILREDGSVLTLQPSGIVPRCSQTEVKVTSVNGIAVTRQTYGEVYDLPDPEEGILYIVSRMVAAAMPNRSDLLIPGPVFRDPETGNPTGCRGLSVL